MTQLNMTADLTNYSINRRSTAEVLEGKLQVLPWTRVLWPGIWYVFWNLKPEVYRQKKKKNLNHVNMIHKNVL